MLTITLPGYTTSLDTVPAVILLVDYGFYREGMGKRDNKSELKIKI